MMSAKITVPKRAKRRLSAYISFVMILLLIFNLVTPALATITPVSDSTYANSGIGFSVTIQKPTDTAQGDVLVACIMSKSSYAGSPEVTAPAGWQLIRTTNAIQNWYYTMSTYYKIAGASEPASYTWTSNQFNVSGGMTRLTGVDINHVVDVSADNQGSAVGAVTATAPSVATTFANDIVINFFGSCSALSLITEQIGMIPLYEYLPPVSGAYDYPSVAAYHWTMGSAANTGTRSCLMTSSISPVSWVTQTVAFKAAPRAYFQVTSADGVEADGGHWISVTLAPDAQGPTEVNFTVGGTAKPGTDYTLLTPSPVTVDTGRGAASIGFNVWNDDLYEENETIVITLDSGQEYFLTNYTQFTYTITNDDFSAPTPVIQAGSSSAVGTTQAMLNPPLLISVSKPSGTVSGDFLLATLIMHGGHDLKVVNTTPPSGWTLIRHTSTASSMSDGVHIFTYYRFATPEDAQISTYTFNFSTFATNDFKGVGGITRYTGLDTVTPIDVTADAVGVADELGLSDYALATAPSVWPDYPNDRMVAVFGTPENLDPTGTGGAFSTPSGMTQLYEGTYSTTLNSLQAVWPSVGAFDMNTLTASGWSIFPNQKITQMHLQPGITSTIWAAQTIALKSSQLSISDASISEGDSSSKNVQITVSLDHPTNSPVNFKWLTTNGTALAGSDYILFGEDLHTIPAGQTSTTFLVPVYGDMTLEPDETFYVDIMNVTGATVADGRGTVTILNDDSNVTINDVSRNEGNSGTTDFVFTVTLTPACNLPVSVDYRVQANEGSATQNVDYKDTTGTVNFDAGQTSKTLTIQAYGDTVYEPNETFVVYLNASTNAHISDSRGIGTIINDDPVPPAITIGDVSRAEGNSGSANLAFTVTLSSTSASDVTVDYATANGSATAGSDYTSTSGILTIPHGSLTGTINVPILGDTVYEQNETFFVNLSNPSNATISDSQAIGTITNDDALTLSVNDVTQNEGNSGATNFTFTVTMSGATTTDVTVHYATSLGTASLGSDYNGVADATLTLTPGETSKTFSIQVNGDTVFEPDETFYVNLSNATVGTIIDAQGLGTIVNDDENLGTAPTVLTHPANQSISYGANATFSASADGIPVPTIRWQVSTNGGSSYSDISDGGLYSGAATGTLSLTKPPVSYSGYQYRAVFSNGIDPAATSNSATLTVAKLGITGSFTTQNKVYDGTTAASVTGRFLNGVLTGDTVTLTGGTATFDTKNVGTGKTVTLSDASLTGTDAGNYTLSSVSTTTANITEKPVTPSVTASDKEYDGTVAATLSGKTLDGVISPDAVTLTVGKAEFSTKNVGTWLVTASDLGLEGADAGNYKLSAVSATGSAKITAKALTVTGAKAENKVYDGSDPATVDFSGASLTGAVSGDDVDIDSTGCTATFTDKNVGTAKTVTVKDVALEGVDAGNYTTSQPQGLTADITALGITGSFTAENKVYDGTTAASVSGRFLSGVVSGDAVTLTGGTAAFDTKNAGTGKTVTLSDASLTGTDAGNYTLSSVSTATANITEKPVIPSVTANNKEYDGTVAATLSSKTLDGVISPDVVTLTVGKAEFASKNVGTWFVTASNLGLDGADAGNYKLLTAWAADTADITGKVLTVTGAKAENKVYDGSDAATVDFSGASLIGVASGDDVDIDSTGCTAAFADKNVGTAKSVTVKDVALKGADAGNYTVTEPQGLAADITPLGITGSFTAENKVYDGTTAASVTGRFLDGVVQGDTVALTGGTAVFDTGNAGTGKTVTLSDASLSGTDSGNYTLSSVATATADITPKPVTPSITANNKVYDGTTAATVGKSLDGVISPDAVSLTVGKAEFANKNVGIWVVTASDFGLEGADAGNYRLSAATATDMGQITEMVVTVTGAKAENKVYDGSDTATVDFSGASLIGVVSGDDVDIDSTEYSAAFADKNVGTAKPVTVKGVSLTGDDAGNYMVTGPKGLTADITALGITGSFTAENKVYDGTTAASVTGRFLDGVLTGDTVTLTGGTATFDTKNVGTGKTVTLSDATLSGTDAGNYSLSSVATTTADITKRAIEVTAVTDTKIYDGTVSSNKKPIITSALGLAAGDSANWTQTFDTKDAGTGKTLTPAGTVNDGNGGDNYTVTFIPVSTGVIEKAKLTVTAQDKTSQYSDPRLKFTATYSGFVAGETLATGGVTGEPSYTTDPALTDPIMQIPGDYTIIPALGTLAAENYDFAFAGGTYTVTIEDASLSFDGGNPVSVKVVSDGGNNASFTWKVIITQADDGNPGDFNMIDPTDIKLTFSAVGSGGGWSGTASDFNPTTGIATFIVPENMLSVETYSATVSLDNDYFKAAQAEDVLVIYDPSLGFTTGGGWFYWPEGTRNPELEGAKINFGYTMKYNRKGTGVQGSFLLIAHLSDGSMIRVKSNAINGLAIIEKGYPGIASFSGKCVYRHVDALGNVIAESGNQEFTVYVKDNNEPGTGEDMIWFTTKLTVAGEAPFTLDSDGSKTVDEDEYVTIGGGNIVVPHTSSSVSDDSSETSIDEPTEEVPSGGKKK